MAALSVGYNSETQQFNSLEHAGADSIIDVVSDAKLNILMMTTKGKPL